MQITFLTLSIPTTALDVVGPYEVLSRLCPTLRPQCLPQSGPSSAPTRGALALEADYPPRPSAHHRHPPSSQAASACAGCSTMPTCWAGCGRSPRAPRAGTTSVCTGALALGAAGILDGLGGHDRTWSCAGSGWLDYGARPCGSAGSSKQGKVVTAAGVSAGIDMALHRPAGIAGPEVAEVDPAGRWSTTPTSCLVRLGLATEGVGGRHRPCRGLLAPARGHRCSVT